jgi:hypothetical protein
MTKEMELLDPWIFFPNCRCAVKDLLAFLWPDKNSRGRARMGAPAEVDVDLPLSDSL